LSDAWRGKKEARIQVVPREQSRFSAPESPTSQGRRKRLNEAQVLTEKAKTLEKANRKREKRR